MSGRLTVRVPHSVWRMFQFDDGGVLAIYEAVPVRSTSKYAEYTMTTAGAAKLLHDVTNAAGGWLDGGTPLENANIVRSAAAYKRTLAKQLMTQLEAPAVITGAPDAPRRAETEVERTEREIVEKGWTEQRGVAFQLAVQARDAAAAEATAGLR